MLIILKHNGTHTQWECKFGTVTMETSMEFLKKLKIKLPYDPAIPLVGIYLEETRIQKDTCTPKFIAVLFLIVRTWKLPKCPSTEEQIKKDMLHIYNGILLSHKKYHLQQHGWT